MAAAFRAASAAYVRGATGHKPGAGQRKAQRTHHGDRWLSHALVDYAETCLQGKQMDPGKAVDVHLAEYQALRTESDHYSQRIDRVIGVYLTALFAVAGYVLRPDGEFRLEVYISGVQASTSAMTLFVFLTILNSALIVRVVTFFMAVLSITQYTYYFTRIRLTDLLNEKVLKWDESPQFSTKKVWVPWRTIGQATFFIIAEFLSIFILWNTSKLLCKSWFSVIFYLAGLGFLLLSVASVIAVISAGRRYHKPGHEQEEQPRSGD